MIVVGLGNPGTKYNHTRHNAGFVAIDYIATKYNFPEFKLSKKHTALVSEGMINEKSVILAKPETFMNKSGASVQSLIKQDKDLLVIHDDIDLTLGTTKIASNSSSAGHKGVQDIIQVLGTQDFNRIRIGIQPKTGKPKDTESFVLKQFSEEEQLRLKEAINQAISLFESSLQKKEEV